MYYHFLGVTSLSDTPLRDMEEKLEYAVNEYEKDFDVELTDDRRREIFDSFYAILDSFEENGKVSETLCFVDNMLINFDYYAFVEDMLEN